MTKHRIYIKDPFTRSYVTNLTFDLENFTDYTLVGSVTDADVVIQFTGSPVEGITDQTIILIDWIEALPTSREYLKDLAEQYPNSKIILTTFLYQLPDVSGIPNVSVHRYNALFNRTKAYYSQFPFSCLLNRTDRPNFYAGQESYKINLNMDLTAPGDCVERVFIFSGRVRSWRRHGSGLRARIAEGLEPYQNLGYYGLTKIDDTTTIPDVGLLSGQEDPLINGQKLFDVETGQVIDVLDTSSTFVRGNNYYQGYAPIHINYYRNSFISFYGESLDRYPVTTEKTYDPLIKGHFVLPFSGPGVIQHLKQQGFLVPDFINYSYDSIKNVEQRLECYLKEAVRLITIPLHEWKELYKENLHIIHHNQRQFWIKPYDRLTQLLNHG